MNEFFINTCNARRVNTYVNKFQLVPMQKKQAHKRSSAGSHKVWLWREFRSKDFPLTFAERQNLYMRHCKGASKSLHLDFLGLRFLHLLGIRINSTSQFPISNMIEWMTHDLKFVSNLVTVANPQIPYSDFPVKRDSQ